MSAYADARASLLRFVEALHPHGRIALTDDNKDVQFECDCGGVVVSEVVSMFTPEQLAMAFAKGQFKIGGEAFLQRALTQVDALRTECTEMLSEFVDDEGRLVSHAERNVTATRRLFELSNSANDYFLQKR
jgi:hypothetical protein